MVVLDDEGAVPIIGDGDDEQLHGEGEPLDLGDDEFRCVECADKQVCPIPIPQSLKEIEDHNIDHLPYRSWCAACVMGRAVGEPHKCKKEDESKRPVVTFGCLFITRGAGKERNVDTRDEVNGKEIILKILVVKDTRSKAIFAHVVSKKGADEEAIKRLMEDIRWL